MEDGGFRLKENVRFVKSKGLRFCIYILLNLVFLVFFNHLGTCIKVKASSVLDDF